jgi:hypothetical protein
MSSVGRGGQQRDEMLANPRRSTVRSLIAPAFVTLDGVMQAPGGPDEDPTGGFTQGGWAVNHWDDTMYSAMGEMLASPFDLLLGRRTYEIFAAHWPQVGAGEREERGGTASDRRPDGDGAQLGEEVRGIAHPRLGHMEQLGPARG